MVENWTWKQGIIPAIKQDIVELFSGVMQINLESLCARLGPRNRVVTVLGWCINLLDT
jgi:hypothetical protein